MKQFLEKKIKSFIYKKIKLNKNSLAGIEIGNVLVAISTTGFMAIGLLPVSLPTLILFAVILLVLGVVGRYMDEVEDDQERLKIYEESIVPLRLERDAYKDIVGDNTMSPSSTNLHTTVSESENSGDVEAGARSSNNTREEG